MTANGEGADSPKDVSESIDEQTVILCDCCLLPVDYGEVETVGGRDYHPECPHEPVGSGAGVREQVERARAALAEARGVGAE